MHTHTHTHTHTCIYKYIWCACMWHAASIAKKQCILCLPYENIQYKIKSIFIKFNVFFISFVSFRTLRRLIEFVSIAMNVRNL